jgi:beta-phosphoglucomutase-like phosphatase (HAD superfamily)
MTTNGYDAVLFDLDGVLTSTAALHARCWKAVFDEVLEDWTRRTGEAQEPFAGDVLRAAGIAGLFDLTVDGHDVASLGLRGKPAPDGFLEAARRLGVDPGRAVVVEDALAGVAAGRDGDFGLVIGVARSAAHEDLRSAGADLVVDDLGELLP